MISTCTCLASFNINQITVITDHGYLMRINYYTDLCASNVRFYPFSSCILFLQYQNCNSTNKNPNNVNANLLTSDLN